MRDWGLFEFFDEWRLATDPGVVWPVIRDVERWSDWWPSVHSVTPVAGDTRSSYEFRFRTRLPYDMAFVADLVRDDRRLTAEARVAGRVHGNGLCTAAATDGGTLVRFDWSVRAWLTWMRAVAPVARPIFAWNHRSLMTEGAAGLAGRLGTRLLADPAGGLLPAARR